MTTFSRLFSNGILILLMIIATSSSTASISPMKDSGSTQEWMKQGNVWVRERLKNLPHLEKPAKNAILFIGDGMSISTVTAARIFKGQEKAKQAGTAYHQQEPLSFERFRFGGLVHTYSSDRHTTDSSASATAFLSGTKTRNELLGVGPETNLRNCSQAREHQVKSIADWAIAKDKHVGFVTTTRVTHATPGGLYAHVANRNWESDDLIADEIGTGCRDIARQLIEDFPGNKMRVIMGGGRGNLLPNTVRDPELEPETNKSQYGRRLDGRNLIEKWENMGSTRKYVWNRTALNSLDASNTDYLMGLFERSHLSYRADMDAAGRTDNPTLGEMTRKAIDILRKGPEGYVLLVEGGRIDHSLHKNKAQKAIKETLDFEEAVQMAANMTSGDNGDTLIVVTSDHGHPMTLIGYPEKDIPILGTFVSRSLNHGLPTTLLTFANGPAAIHQHDTHPKLIGVNTEGKDFEQPTYVSKTKWSSHSGEDVGIYSQGNRAKLFTGVIDNHFIAHGLAYALCISPSWTYDTGCMEAIGEEPPTSKTTQDRSVLIGIIVALLLSFILCIVSISLLLYYLRVRKQSQVADINPMACYSNNFKP